MPEKTEESRSEQQSIAVLDEAEIDHRPILVEYPELSKKANLKPSQPTGLGQPFFFAPPTYPASLRRHTILGDGNCLFRAIGHFTGHDHRVLRAIAVNHLLQHWDEYQGFVEHPDYVADMAGNGVWAGHLALVAVASHLDLQIIVYRFDGTQVRINQTGTNGPIHLYYTGNHYDALVERQLGHRPRLPQRHEPSRMPFERFLVTTVIHEIRKLTKRKPHRKELATVLRYVLEALKGHPHESKILRRRDPSEALIAERVIRYLVRAALKFGAFKGSAIG